ncbi:tetratricopeptide repeat protein [Nitratireductor indicus]|uniref:tetratricopeptide repeat protein n=1 Tax=Nitratireductor indicus TaxID=721133 RepID=UPI002874EA14|nr:SEL1-like repeat protein [Nitratireductor indicus]MDS1136235.1 SEL1-like repeat protein [Nitratireductor indicus]
MKPADYWPALRAPLLALVLGVAPFWIFFGTGNSLTVDGELVRQSNFNIAGLVLGIAGAVIAFRALREGGLLVRLLLAGIALAVSVFQIAWSVELVTRDHVRQVVGYPMPEEPEYNGPDLVLQHNMRLFAHQNDEAKVRERLIEDYGLLLARFASHKDYADACHGGTLRIDEDTMQLPDFLEAEVRSEIDARAQKLLEKWGPMPCGTKNSLSAMKKVPEAILKQRDILPVLASAYRRRFVEPGTSGTTPRPFEGDPILKEAEEGNLTAQAYLGDYFYRGEIVKQDFEQAALWYMALVENTPKDTNDPDSLVLLRGAGAALGSMYQEGRGVARDAEQAVKWYTMAAEAGSVRAAYNLGAVYEQGLGVASNDALAAEWYAKAAESWDPYAAFKLAMMYREGRGVKRDEKRARELLIIAGKNGDAGIAALLLEPAMAGDADAQFALGTILYGKTAGVQDQVKAIEWFHKAAEQGQANAQYKIGELFAYGSAGQKDPVRAAKWILMAAERGLSAAQVHIGVMYQHGDGVPKDEKQAFEWQSKAAAQDDKQGALNLGILYANGIGVEEDLGKAEEWLRKAHALGHTSADKMLRELAEMKQKNADAR